VTGGGKDTLQVAGTALGAGDLYLLLFVHHQDLLVFVTFHAFKFENGHLILLNIK
jgi:hypothetical protein